MKLIITNKFPRYEYEILEKYECGISLLGWEVKSLRAKNANLNNSFCSIKNDEIILNNLYISQYMNVTGDYSRSRKLLLHKNEIYKIMSKKERLSLQLIPTQIYWKDNYIKVEIALAKHLKVHDKRQKMIKEENDKKLQKILKNYQ
ncbi:SsrA-binding protein SmpB [[Mycoplasma] gypis]|uniref:SsrA-binding protein n=1 Tax=[Mycoplasma] gypis TaxID=92404 RepID=A0ABZ2RNQ4_9BACT|nr:SsrA-binding protein SmpB [[Mycoplasma] gypis]MBN0919300.1 SsrA-binding protein SmpB [[Mycoplasma] gypis]